MSSPGSEMNRGSVSGGETSLLTLVRFSLGTTAALGIVRVTGGLGLDTLALALGVRGGEFLRTTLGEADSDRSTRS